MKSRLTLFKTLLLWVVALQLLNMSMCSEAYWSYFNNDHPATRSDKQVDPTETFVEWIVEMKMGQQDAFTYDRNNIGSKNTFKATGWQIDLRNQPGDKIKINLNRGGTEIFYSDIAPELQTIPSEITSPPPEISRTF